MKLPKRVERKTSDMGAKGVRREFTDPWKKTKGHWQTSAKIQPKEQIKTKTTVFSGRIGPQNLQAEDYV